MRNVSKTAILLFAGAAAVTVLTTGCARTPLQTEAATSGIRAAEEVGAADLPQASLHLQLAKEELENARQLDAKNEKDKAASMLLRSEADAELAVVLSREEDRKSVV